MQTGRLAFHHLLKLLEVSSYYNSHGLIFLNYAICRNIVHGSDSPENGKREIGEISCFLKNHSSIFHHRGIDYVQLGY